MTEVTFKRETTAPFKLGPEHTVTVLHTTNHQIFHYIPGNRPISKSHVQDIITSFEDRPGLVELRPILVNERMEIIDGQHRLQALEFLEAPVPYIVAPGLTLRDAQVMNALQRPWLMQDYLQSYALSGIKSYKLLLELQEQFDVGLGSLILYTGSRDIKGRDVKKFRLGKFEMKEDMLVIQDRLQNLRDFGETFPWWNTMQFARALLRIMKSQGGAYDHARLLKGYRAMEPHRKSQRIDYVLDLERAYNFNRPESKFVKFL